jgi:hypothetical protein
MEDEPIKNEAGVNRILHKFLMPPQSRFSEEETLLYAPPHKTF